MYENLKKNNFFNLKSNFDQATQKKLKKLACRVKLIPKMPTFMAPI